ncbi:MAG: 2-C-methyl-D-erythritol 4-phosphate cytidylyltransferase [Syntrophomonadaceae bacterium]|nr:2-C-methyl-D-erythritol 4-phosphate cytidylyltransferase [Syntrophomonadaceae bacterium]
MDDNLRVVIAAAGAGSRMGKKINKQYMLLKSRPLLTYSLDVFEKSPLVEEIVIVAHPQEIEYCEREIVKKYGYKKVNSVVAGGKERQDSIWAGLKQLGSDTAYVAVHDGARPFISSVLIEELLQEAKEWGAAIPGVAVKDTLKHVDRDGFVRQTLDRASIIAVQTPQIFKYAELCEAYANAYEEGLIVTDDAGLFEKYIGRVKVVTGDYFNIKITTPEDMLIAKSLIKL